MKIEINGSFIRLVEDASLIQDTPVPCVVKFIFDESWEGFSKTALFKTDESALPRELVDDQCVIPAECLKKAGIRIRVNVVGTKGPEQISTGWCATGMIMHRISLGSGQGGPPALPDDVYEQIMAVVGDLSAAGFEGKTLSQIIIELRNNISGTATDREVEEMLELIFGCSSSAPLLPGNTATDEEVDAVLNEVFGKKAVN